MNPKYSFSATRLSVPWALAVCAALVVLPAQAVPFAAASDETIVETLPVLPAWQREARALKRALARAPRDEGRALALARAHLEMARSEGDARQAGYALGALAAWQDGAAVPADIRVMRATIRQFLHDFDAAEDDLRAALASDLRHAQAWLTLATITRLKGRLGESARACEGLARAGQPLYARACAAENMALGGRTDAARQEFHALLGELAGAGPAADGVRGWLFTSLAAVEQLAARPAAAGKAYRAALAAAPDGYTRLAYADLLLEAGRPAEVFGLLAGEPDSDGVLLRRAIAARAGGDARGAELAGELRRRFAAIAERPGGATQHLREQARFALDIEGDAARALALARSNLQQQREAEDLLLFARAAAALPDRSARLQLDRMMSEMGVKDARIEAIG